MKSLPTSQMLTLAPTSRLRALWATGPRLAVFFRVCLSSRGLGSAIGRILIWGKIRRSFLSFSPRLALWLKKKHGIQGECRCCGVSCNLLFECPQWNKQTRLCGIYGDRPAVCRLFPITPQDLVEVRLANPQSVCGFSLPDLEKTSAPTRPIFPAPEKVAQPAFAYLPPAT